MPKAGEGVVESGRQSQIDSPLGHTLTLTLTLSRLRERGSNKATIE
jgi:hypothetical protein